MSETALSKRVVYAALVGNLFVAVTKFIAAAWSGSSSMTSEAVHSLVDTGNEGLLIYGYARASRPPDENHPLGYGRELYFWSFIVSLLLFAIGAGVSIYEGITHIIDPNPLTDTTMNFVVLALSALFEGASWWIALKRFDQMKGRRTYWQAIRDSKDPPSFMVLFEDTAALIGIALSALGNFAAAQWHIPELDGVASICIGLVLAVAAALLARENKALLIGERASDEVVASILALAKSEPGVEAANNVFAVHLAPEQIIVALSLEFTDACTAPEIELAVCGLEDRIKQARPEVIAVFVKPQTARTFAARKSQIFNADTAAS
jgi:cation diffusion facilitator family transporter